VYAQVQLKQKLRRVTDSELKDTPTASYKKFYTIRGIELKAASESAIRFGYMETLVPPTPSGWTGPAYDASYIAKLPLLITIPDTKITYNDTGLVTFKSNPIVGWKAFVTEWIGKIQPLTPGDTNKAKVKNLAIGYATVYLNMRDATLLPTASDTPHRETNFAIVLPIDYKDYIVE
jgi:hypothetical protein